MADLKPGVLSETTVLNKETRKYSYLDLIKTPQMRRLTLLTGILWFGVSCSSHQQSSHFSGSPADLIQQSGLGYSSFMALTGVSVSPLIMVLEELWLPLPGIVFSLVAFAAGLSACLLSETNNSRLPETIEDVEQTRAISPDI
ncbi:hypothetical protein NQZ68_005903 [Dissostichus eleginoides]|nr:hypothetical protein NQZ68_005903 [Dissostichus eleginoides]